MFPAFFQKADTQVNRIVNKENKFSSSRKENK